MSSSGTARHVLPEALAGFTARVRALHFYDDEIDRLISALPPMPLSYTPSNAGTIALSLALQNVGTLRVANESTRSFQKLWISGLLTNVGLPARLLFELWGSACYAQNLAEMLADRRSHSKAFDKSTELFLGSRGQVPQFSGYVSDIPPIHVMDMVRAITRVRSDAVETYGFLSEACHPNYLQQTYLWFAGPAGDNWSNQKFASYGMTLIERLIGAVEAATEGVIQASRMVQHRANGYIANDRERSV